MRQEHCEKCALSSVSRLWLLSVEPFWQGACVPGLNKHVGVCQGATWQQAVQWVEEMPRVAGQQFTVVVKHDTYGFSFALQRDQKAAQDCTAAVEKSSVPLWVSITSPLLGCAKDAQNCMTWVLVDIFLSVVSQTHWAEETESVVQLNAENFAT